MKDYFNLTIEEKIALANKRDFTPEHFSREESTTLTTTTIKPE